MMSETPDHLRELAGLSPITENFQFSSTPASLVPPKCNRPTPRGEQTRIRNQLQAHPGNKVHEISGGDFELNPKLSFLGKSITLTKRQMELNDSMRAPIQRISFNNVSSLMEASTQSIGNTSRPSASLQQVNKAKATLAAKVVVTDTTPAQQIDDEEDKMYESNNARMLTQSPNSMPTPVTAATTQALQTTSEISVSAAASLIEHQAIYGDISADEAADRSKDLHDMIDDQEVDILLEAHESDYALTIANQEIDGDICTEETEGSSNISATMHAVPDMPDPVPAASPPKPSKENETNELLTFNTEASKSLHGLHHTKTTPICLEHQPSKTQTMRTPTVKKLLPVPRS